MAPRTPMTMVMMQPPGSRPGIRNLAMAPAISPHTIHDRIPVISALLSALQPFHYPEGHAVRDPCHRRGGIECPRHGRTEPQTPDKLPTPSLPDRRVLAHLPRLLRHPQPLTL